MTHEEKLKELREKYKYALGTDRQIIIRQARALEHAIKKRDKKGGGK